MKAFRVFYVASDLAPLTGSGDFAKEVHFLSRAMAGLDMDVTVAVPGYRATTPTAFGIARRLTPLMVNTANAPFESTVHEGNLAGGRVKVFVLDVPGKSEGLPAQQPAALTVAQKDAFCRAAIALAGQEEHRPDVIIAGPGTEPVLAMAKEQLGADPDPRARAPVTVFALRDLDVQMGLAEALPHADRIVVSSPTLAASLRQRPERDPLGRLLAPVRDAVHGIISGIDSVTWNPQHDRLAVSDIAASKAEHKRELKRRLGLRGGSQAPLIALIGPFDARMLTDKAARDLDESNALLVVLASAQRDRAACERFADLARHGRGVLRKTANLHELAALEHELLCAADFCVFARGASPTAPLELYSMHYGVVPIAPSTTGFADVLVEFDARTATGSGFLFDPAKEGQIGAAVARALHAYRQSQSFSTLVERVTHFDLSWRTTAQRYADMVRQVLHERDGARPDGSQPDGSQPNGD